MDRSSVGIVGQTKPRATQPLQMASLGRLLGLFLLTAVFLSSCAVLDRVAHKSVVAFLGWDSAGMEQLFTVTEGSKPVQITTFDTGVTDYAPNRAGDAFLVASPSSADGSELWLQPLHSDKAELVYSCEMAECSAFEWSADGRKVMFERRAIGEDGRIQAPELWWLDVVTGDTLPVLAGENEQAAAGRLSADEQWLGYVSPLDAGILLYNFGDGRRQFITNETGTPVSWSPIGSELVVPRLELASSEPSEGDAEDDLTHDEQTVVHLFYMDLASGVSRSISGDLNVEDSVPAWSPDGEWLAYGRRVPRTNSPRQLWIMRKDGSEARPVATEAGTTYGPPQWTADGRSLVFQRFVQDQPASDPAIWKLNLETNTLQELAPAGMLPRVLAE